MKVLLIYPNRTAQEGISAGLAYISGGIKKSGHTVKLFDFTWGEKIENCLRSVKTIKPDIIGLSTTSLDYDFSLLVSEKIKENFDIPIVFGGVHPTIAPQEVISNKSVDIVCRGEGEFALAELLEKMENGKDYFNTENFWFKKNEKIIKNDVRPLIQNLDMLICDRELFDITKYLESRNGFIDIYAGRGCPYFCTYCINHFYQELYSKKGKYVRLRSINNIINEIVELSKKYNVKGIVFPDDTFTYNKKWVLEFCDTYRKKVGLPFVCNARVENLDDEVCKALNGAGCDKILLGVESGSEEIRRNVLKRYMSDEQIINAFKLCKKNGIKTFSFNMVGIPNETEKDIKKTIELNRKLEPDELQVTIFYPFSGTQLYNVCKENGWITDKKITSYSAGSILQYNQITMEEIKKIRDLFAYNVFVKYNKKLAIKYLFIGLLYNYYLDYRSRTPMKIRKLIQKYAHV